MLEAVALSHSFGALQVTRDVSLTVSAGVAQVIEALEAKIPIVQGPYDCCTFVRESGYQRFRALEGSHAGAEGTVQQTPASQIVFSIPLDRELLATTDNAHSLDSLLPMIAGGRVNLDTLHAATRELAGSVPDALHIDNLPGCRSIAAGNPLPE